MATLRITPKPATATMRAAQISEPGGDMVATTIPVANAAAAIFVIVATSR